MSVQCPHCRSSLILDGQTPREVVCPSCGSSVQLDPDGTPALLSEQAPKRLGKFEFLEQIGTGGFGVVYKARDTELDRLVAIKIPRTGNIPKPEDMDRFLREARSAARLVHPGIVSLHDAGTIDGTCCLVSEFIQGATLAERLTARSFTYNEAAQLIAEVADALQYAHQHGVVHRDIKPSNIMLDLHGRPHLMDFGLAKRTADDVALTLEGQVLGTPAYMSPEQARGEVHKVDARSDLYSLGVILYELLTGERPFRGQVRMLLVQVMQDEPRPPRRINDRIPRDLETICQKAMAKEPSRRYATARDFADDLRRFQKGEPIAARPAGTIERFWRWRRRNPVVAGLVAALLVVFLTGFGLVTWKWLEAEQLRENERKARVQSDVAKAEADQRTEEIRQGLIRLNAANRLTETARIDAIQGRFADADRQLSEAVHLRPDHSYVWSERGNLFVRLGLWKHAADEFGNAFKLQRPAYAYQWFNLAVLRLHSGDREGCRQICAEIMDIYEADSNVWALAQAARCCSLFPKPVVEPARLVRLAQSACDREPSIAMFQYNLGVALIRAGEYQKAIASLHRSLEFAPDWTSKVINYPMLAIAHHHLGQQTEARQELSRAAETIDLWNEELLSRPPGYLPTQWEDCVEFQVYYREATQLIEGTAPDDPRLGFHEARALNVLGRKEESTAAYTRALAAAERYEGRNAKWLKQMSWAVVSRPMMEAEHYGSALRLVEKALRLDSNSKFWNTHGAALYRVGNYKAARSRLELCDFAFQFANKGRSHPADVAFLAMTYHRQGEKQKAQAALERLRKAISVQGWAESAAIKDYAWEARVLVEGNTVANKP